MKGKFIVLEGIDGCGKTTQIQLIKRWLEENELILKGRELKITREPGGTNLGKNIRSLLLDTNGDNCPYPSTELLLYAADRAQHISQLIMPNLEKGNLVISDRFSGSTIAYQGYGRGLEFKIINQLEEIATQGISPDITFWIDIDLNKSIQRRAEKTKDRIEKEGMIFLKKVSSGFSSLSKERNWIRIDGNKMPNEVNISIQKHILNLLS